MIGDQRCKDIYSKMINEMISKIRESGADISSSERDMGNIIDIYNSLVTKKELDIVRTKSI